MAFVSQCERRSQNNHRVKHDELHLTLTSGEIMKQLMLAISMVILGACQVTGNVTHHNTWHDNDDNDRQEASVSQASEPTQSAPSDPVGTPDNPADPVNGGDGCQVCM